MPSERVLIAGETLCDFFARSEAGLGGQRFERRAGGAPANVAVGLARLGVPSLLWTRVGRDPFGDDLIRTLEREGVSLELIERDPGTPTTLAFVDPETTDFQFYRGADAKLGAENAPSGHLDDVDWMVAGGVALSQAPSREAVTSLLQSAARKDCEVLFDPNERPELWRDRDFGGTIRDRLPFVDVLTATRNEIATLAPDAVDLSSRIDDITEMGPHTVSVTEGPAGARLYATADAPWGPAEAVHEGYLVDAIDPVGAGDAFNAGLLAGIVRRETDAYRLLERANGVAALTTTAVGAMESLPRAAVVADFLDEHE